MIYEHKTIVDMAREYLAAIHPDGVGSVQAKETRQAFLCGFMEAMAKINTLADLPQSVAEESIRRWGVEMVGFGETMRERADAARRASRKG